MNWFTRNGILYRPVSAIGWMILVVVVVSSVYLFFKIDSSSHSASDTLRNWILCDLMIAAAYTLIGYLASRGNWKLK